MSAREGGTAKVSRGEIHWCDFAPVIGTEQNGIRPALIVSNDMLNHGPSGLVIVCPVTKHAPRVPAHIPVPEGEGGLKVASTIMCDQVRTVSRERLRGLLGTVTPDTLSQVSATLRRLIP